MNATKDYLRKQRQADIEKKQPKKKEPEELPTPEKPMISKEKMLATMYLGKTAGDLATGQKSKINLNKVLFFSNLIDDINTHPTIFIFGVILGIVLGLIVGGILGLLFGVVL